MAKRAYNKTAKGSQQDQDIVDEIIDEVVDEVADEEQEAVAQVDAENPADDVMDNEITRYVIKGMLSEQKNTYQIAETLGVTEQDVQRVIEEMMTKDLSEEEALRGRVTPEVWEKTQNELTRMGLNELAVRRVMMDAARDLLPEFKPDNYRGFFITCLRNFSVMESMITKTESGASGVSIMTHAASMRSDDKAKKAAKKTKPSRNHIFRPRG